MRKEVFIAIFIGITLGLTMTYGIYIARNSLINQPVVLASPTPNAEPVEIQESSLVLSSPEDGQLVSTSEQTVSGTTKAGSFVVITLFDQDQVTTADSTGHFSVSVQLKPGGNIITVTAVDEDGQKTTIERAVVLAVDEFLSVEDSSSSAKPSPASNAAQKANSL